MILLLLLLLLPFQLSADSFFDDELFFADTDGITIVGTEQISQYMSIIEKEEIERRGASDIAALLNETLGLNIVRHGAYGSQSGISLRGQDSKRVAFLIDGIPVNSPLDGKFDINQIDLNSIERIEVVHGGSDSRLNVSGAIGGVINIITVKKQPMGFRFGGSAYNTSFMPGGYLDRNGQTQESRWEDLVDTQNLALFGAYGGGNFSAAANLFANRAQNHFLFTDSAGHTRRKDNNEVMDGGGGASFVWDLPDHSTLIASSNFYYGDKNLPTSGFSEYFNKQEDFYSRQNLLLQMPHAFHDALAAEASLSWQFSRRDYDFSRHDLHSIGAINRWHWYAADQFILRSGVDYQYISLDSTEMKNRDRHDGGIYLTAEISPSQRWLFIPSVKGVFTNGGSGNAAIIPKLGILWNMRDNFAVKSNFYRSFKFPDFEELYWTGIDGTGNPDLRPEDGWGADFGIASTFFDIIYLERVYFIQWVKDSIHWFESSPAADGASIWRPENSGNAVLLGAEFKLNVEFPVEIGPIKKIIPSGLYRYALSYLLSHGYTIKSRKSIPYTPEHTLNISLDFVWNSGSFLLSSHYEGLRPHDINNDIILSPNLLFNAAVNQKMGENFAVFGVIRNIFNKSYQSFYDYPMPGVNLTLGLRYTGNAIYANN